MPVPGAPPLRAIAAQNADVAQAFAGLRLPDGTTWESDVLQAVLRVEEVYRVVYASVSDDSMVIVSIDLSRHADAAGAQRLQEIIDQQPLASGEVVVPIHVTLDDVGPRGVLGHIPVKRAALGAPCADAPVHQGHVRMRHAVQKPQ